MKRKGFTLIELLAVIIILGSLATIITPIIITNITNSKNAAYIESVKAIKRAAQQYVIDNDIILPSEDGETLSININDLSLYLDNTINPVTKEPFTGNVTVLRINGSYFYNYGDKPTIVFSNNGTSNYVKNSSTKVTVIDDTAINASSLKYQWTTSELAPKEETFTQTFTNKDTIATPNLSGKYYLWILAKDEVDNTTIQGSNVFNLDNTGPVITILGDNPYSHEVGGIYTDNGATSNDNVNGDLTSKIITSSNVISSVVGNYKVTYNSTDLLGNTTTIERIVNVTDNVKPIVTFGSNGNSSYASSYSTTITISDNGAVNTNSLKYQWSTSDTAPSEASFTTTFTSGGSISTPAGVSGGYYLWILAKDSAGNTTITKSNVFNLDNTLPTVAFGTNGNTNYAKTYSTTVTVSDNKAVNASSLEYQWTTSDTAPSEASFTTTFTSGGSISTPTGVSGGYYLWILAKDSATNTVITKSNVFNLDNTAPVITLNGNASINFAIGTTSSYSDAGATATDNIDGTITARITTVVPTISTFGTYTVTYNVTDNTGNTATQVTRTVVVNQIQVEYLIVAGGGGGGMNHAGGGGAGGLLQGTTSLATLSSNSITVGNGGAAATTQASPAPNGGNSVALGLTAIGGGGGGCRNDSANNSPGQTGGSGGGGGGAQTSYPTNWNSGSGTTGQGNAGGRAVDLYGGGGGGAGGAGTNASSGVCGDGGAGISSSISGTSKYYAGGGGGGSGSNGSEVGAGGSGIGGNGSYTTAFNGTYPAVNTGSGGGGGGPGNGIGSAGSAGIVIVKYYGAQRASGGSITSVGGYTIHSFTGSGTLTIN